MDFLKWFRTQWDRITAGVLVVLGIVTLIIGYVGASGTPYPAEQLPYMISGGVLGIFFLGAAAALYVSADLRDEWRKLNSIDVSLKEIVGSTTLDDEGGIGAATVEPAAQDAPTGPLGETAPTAPAVTKAAAQTKTKTPAKRSSRRTATSRS